MVEITPKNEDGANEPELIREAVNGDVHAFGGLYDMHLERVHRHIYYRVGNREDAQDLTQQVFLKAWHALPKYRQKSSPFIAWLLTISNNLVIDYYRKNKARQTEDIEKSAYFLKDGQTLNPEQAAESGFESKRVWGAIRQLPANHQQLIVLRFMDGCRNPEIATILGLSEGSVRVNIHRALKKLRQIIKEDEEA